MNKGTKDMKYVLALYEAAVEKGDAFMPVDRYLVGARVGIQRVAVNTICKLLVQANFIRKESEEEIYLTDHGLSLVRDLQKR